MSSLDIVVVGGGGDDGVAVVVLGAASAVAAAGTALTAETPEAVACFWGRFVVILVIINPAGSSFCVLSCNRIASNRGLRPLLLFGLLLPFLLPFVKSLLPLLPLLVLVAVAETVVCSTNTLLLSSLSLSSSCLATTSSSHAGRVVVAVVNDAAVGVKRQSQSSVCRCIVPLFLFLCGGRSRSGAIVLAVVAVAVAE
jgi:hypothetical protein